MSDLQTVFYITAIIYMVFNIVLLVGVGIGIYFVFQAIKEMRRKVEEKMKYVDRVIQHPEEVAAEIGASLIRIGIRRVKSVFKRGNTTSV